MFAHPLIQALALAATIGATQGDPPVPAGLRRLPPHEVVAQLLEKRSDLGLSWQQTAQLDSLHLAIRSEKHRYTREGLKAHQLRHVPMTSRKEAFGQAVAVLTPEQQSQLAAALSARLSAPQPLADGARMALARRRVARPASAGHRDGDVDRARRPGATRISADQQLPRDPRL